jgi:hypothetical protein
MSAHEASRRPTVGRRDDVIGLGLLAEVFQPPAKTLLSNMFLDFELGDLAKGCRFDRRIGIERP